MATPAGKNRNPTHTKPQMSSWADRVKVTDASTRLHGLPFTLWSRKGLSVAASVVGKPLSCDEPTFCCTRLDFVRVCVEIDAAKPLIYKYDLASPCPNEPLHIEVEYEWKPARCDKCKLFGHACKEYDGKDMEAESRPPVVNHSQNDNQLQVTGMKPTSSRAREAKEANLEIASKASVPSWGGKERIEMTQEDNQHNKEDARVRKGKVVAEDLSANQPMKK
ncbi:hypothetical protein SADUNF_Sadunf19G0061900 [Salix dunnii]|uniref:DUF4283 domain-containing protein n=1 Tax=Salix dunnii TaxID=1413687 RepID=A0A835MHS1_9ROSI|nr:hypothetical protein SADUNF_Sadunf19G0061900 [Salix dunnii]